MTRDYSPPITIRPADQISSALLIYNTRHLPLCPLNILHFSKVQTNCTRSSSSSSQIPAESSAHDASVPDELWAQRDQPALECVK